VRAAAASFVLTRCTPSPSSRPRAGAEELETGSVSAWAEPARDLAGGLVTFVPADSVYFTYLKSLALIGPALILCAWTVRSRHRPATRASYRPRLTPWLLVFSVPFWLVGSDVLGHNSLGLVPLFVA
jgi:hypothetical protein